MQAFNLYNNLYTKIILIIFVLFSYSAIAFCHNSQPSKSNSQQPHTSHQTSTNTLYTHPSYAQFIPDVGQWNNQFLFKAPLGTHNTLFVGKNALTYVVIDSTDAYKTHDWHQLSYHERKDKQLRAHAYQVDFLASNENVLVKGIDQHPYYHNYFIGKDAERWQSEVAIYNSIVYQNLYDNIDLNIYKMRGNLKYDFKLCPNADYQQIQLAYRGQDNIFLKDGNLHIVLSSTNITETKPYAYQVIDGKTIEVSCNYVLRNNVLGFDFPEGYNQQYDLIIDPLVVAATLSGTTYETFGHCATYDSEFNIYTGGVAFGIGYPATLGAFDIDYNGSYDIAISKYNPDGSNLLYATYLGGESTDNPISLINDNEDNLYIYGSSGSYEYPISSSAFQTTNNGVVDIIVSKLSADGTSLLASTFIGGQAIDGEDQLLRPFYGDQYRGEIILDDFGSVYIATTTASWNFPIDFSSAIPMINTSTVFQAGVVMKLGNNLSFMEWSSFITGSGGVTNATSLRVASNGNVYVTGTTTSSDFPTSLDAYQASGSSLTDAYVSCFSPDGSTIPYATYWGSNSNDYGYFLDLDPDENVHIYGVNLGGNLPITAGTFSNPNSSQYIASFTPELNDLRFSTLIGSGSGSPTTNDADFVPVAFMIDECFRIFISGHGEKVYIGSVPLTPDAISFIGGFYVAVLEPEASTLLYATKYSADHVDGGTSRFYPGGLIYQGVCSGNGPGSFNTTPNAFSTDQVVDWDIGVFVIDLETNINANFTAVPESFCNTITINFTPESSIPIDNYLWDFGDGNTSTEILPSHQYDNYGTYTVKLTVATDYCDLSEEVEIDIEVIPPVGLSNYTEIDLCNEDSYEAIPYLAGSNSWNTGGSGTTNIFTETGLYYVDIVTPEGCEVRDTFQLNFYYTEFETLVYQACSDENIIFEGTSIPSGESADFSYINQFNCDSIVSVQVETLPDVLHTEQFYVCAGESITIEGVELGIGDSEVFTYTATNGCDSIVTVNIATLSNSFIGVDLATCDGTTIEFDGVDLAPGDLEDFVYVSANGCDSTVLVSVDGIPNIFTNQTILSCPSGSTFFDGVELIVGDVEDFYYPAANGCDSIVTVTVDALPDAFSSSTITACEGYTTLFEGEEMSIGESRDFYYPAANGCDSIVTITVAPLPNTTGSATFLSCLDDTYLFEGVALNVGDVQDFTFTAANGCDSIVTVNIDAIPNVFNTASIFACQGYPTTFEGVNLNIGDVQDFTFPAANGCDSIVTITVEEIPSSNSFEIIYTCENTSTFFDGVELNIGDLQNFTYTAANGCDSIVTISVASIPVITSSVSLEACINGSVMFDGQNLTAGVVQDFAYIANNGCDSVVTVTVTPLPPILNTETLFTCAGTNVLLEGTELFIGDVQDFFYQTPEGCDSIVTVNVEEIVAINVAESLFTCANESINFEGNLLSAGDFASHTYVASNGCDSIVTVTVEPIPVYNTSDTLFVCGNESTNFEGVNLVPGDEQMFTLTSSLGCDSNVLITVLPVATYTNSLTLETCDNVSTTWEGVALNAGDTQDFTYTATNGCDSIVTVTVNGVATYSTASTLATCLGTSINYEGIDLLVGDVQDFAYTATNGCDSVATITVEALPAILQTQTYFSCQNIPYEFEGTSIAAGTAQDFNYTAINGCDSIVTIVVNPYPIYNIVENISVCEGDSIATNGTFIVAGSSQTFNLSTINGCDSIVTVNVAALPVYNETTNIAVCDNSSTFIDGVELFPLEVQTFEYTTVDGCDSLVTFTIEALPTYDLQETPATCEGDSILFDGSWIMAGDSQNFAYSTVNGCDSIIGVEVIAYPVYDLIETFSICDNETTFFDGVELLPEQVEPFFYTTVNGCDSIITVFVESRPTFDTFHTFEACTNDTYWVDSIGILAGESDSILYTAINGCDSIAHVEIVALPIHSAPVWVEICPDEVHITNDTTMLPNTEQTFNLLNEFGCDSIVTVTVYAPEPLNFLPEVTEKPCDDFADGQISLLNAVGGTPPYQYSLDGVNYQDEAEFFNIAAGEFVCYVRDSNLCTHEIPLTVIQTISFELDIFEEIKTCENDPNTLIPNIDAFEWDAEVSYTWQDGSTNDEFTTTNLGNYVVTSFDGCSTIRTHYNLVPAFYDYETPFLVVNAFSPNGDGINDGFWGIPTIREENIVSYQMMVYDRWGNELFTTSEYTHAWDGQVNAFESSLGVYVWLLKAEIINCAGDIQTVLEKGNLTIIR